MAALSPYDIIIFFAVWIISGVVWGVVAACRTCGICAKKTDATDQPPAAVVSSAPAKADGADAPPTVTTGEPAAGAAQESSDPPLTAGRVLMHVGIALVATFVIAFVLTMIIMAIMGAAGMVSLFVFSPASYTTCSSSCAYSTRDGLDGWVDETCCTYQPTGLGEYYDVWLSVTDAARPSAAALQVHGWLMINRTKRTATDKPITLIYNHGSGGNVAMGYRIQRYQYLLQRGNIAILTFDYTGYGKSSGTTNTANVMLTALGATTWFASSISQPAAATGVIPAAVSGVNDAIFATKEAVPTKVIVPADRSQIDVKSMTILGRSMGGGVAGYVVAQTKNTAKNVIIQSTWSNLEDISTSYFPMFGWIWAGFATSQYSEFSNTKNFAAYGKCVYHAHSKTDEWIDYSQALKLESSVFTKVATASCSQFVTNDNAIHTQPLTTIERATLAAWMETQRNV